MRAAPGSLRAARRAGSRALLPLLLAAAACGEGAPHAARSSRYEIRIDNFRYLPDSLTVAVGDTVAWTNHDFVPHTATAENHGWDTGIIAADSTRTVVMQRAGTYPYLCTLHPVMRGVLRVR
jgi:plastocyanin